MAFIPQSELIPEAWYACNFGAPQGRQIGAGRVVGGNSWDFVVGGPFGSKEQALQWVSRTTGQRDAHVLQRRI